MRFLFLIIFLVCLTSCAQIYLANKKFSDKDGNQVALTNTLPNVFDENDEIMTSPCLKLPKAYYYKKNEYIVNGCWYYADEKIIFIGFDKVKRIFDPQWQLKWESNASHEK
jgi:hypothetical protein